MFSDENVRSSSIASCSTSSSCPRVEGARQLTWLELGSWLEGAVLKHTILLLINQPPQTRLLTISSFSYERNVICSAVFEIK